MKLNLRKDKQNETIFELKNCLENDQHSKKAWVKIDKQGNVTAGCHRALQVGLPRFTTSSLVNGRNGQNRKPSQARNRKNLLKCPACTGQPTSKDRKCSLPTYTTCWLFRQQEPAHLVRLLSAKIKYDDKDTDTIRNWEDRETLELTTTSAIRRLATDRA